MYFTPFNVRFFFFAKSQSQKYTKNICLTIENTINPRNTHIIFKYVSIHLIPSTSINLMS